MIWRSACRCSDNKIAIDTITCGRVGERCNGEYRCIVYVGDYGCCGGGVTVSIGYVDCITALRYTGIKAIIKWTFVIEFVLIWGSATGCSGDDAAAFSVAAGVRSLNGYA